MLVGFFEEPLWLRIWDKYKKSGQLKKILSRTTARE